MENIEASQDFEIGTLYEDRISDCTGYDGDYNMSYIGQLQQVNCYIICEKVIAIQLLKSQQAKKMEYIAMTDGLFGKGIYLYEGNYPLLYNASRKSGVSGLQNPVVLGVAVQLGKCINLLECDVQHMFMAAYNNLSKLQPKSKITDAHVIKEIETKSSIQYTSIRWLDTHNKALYKNSAFLACDTRVCIKDTNCITGYFIQK